MKLTHPTRRPRWPACLWIVGLVLVASYAWRTPPARSSAQPAEEPNRSPVDLLLTGDEKYLLTANQTSNTVSLVDVATGQVLAEVPCGRKPSALALTPDEKTLLVTGTWSGDVSFYKFADGKLSPDGSLFLGFEPRGVVVAPDGQTAYVAQTSAHKIAIIDLQSRKIGGQIDAGQWPRYMAISSDGKYLAVGANGDRGAAVVDLAAGKLSHQDRFAGINLGQMQVSRDNKFVYFPWMTYLANPITRSNIQRGWVLASRIARLRLDQYERREAISLDPQGEAIADPHGLALSPDEQWVVCSASGSQELLVYRLPGLPFQAYGGPGDHIDPRLLNDKERFYRIPLGGRPMFVRYSKDGRHAYVANYLLNAVQVVDVPGKKVVGTIELGGPKEQSLARRGEAIFYDGKKSLDQWYSCHSCHYEGHTSSMAMDTFNDKTGFTAKTVLSLRNVTRTFPWTWHGWQTSLEDAMHTSLTETMLGKAPTDEDKKALIAFLDTLQPPPNPYRHRDGSLTESAQRGKAVFESEKAGCIRCHHGEYFTSKRTYDVGLGGRSDRYPGYNPPSLLGIYDRVLYLHDGRASSLEEILRGPHAPDRVTGNGKLSDDELRDLVEYVKSL